MLPFHIFGFSLNPKTTLKYLYTQQSIEDIALYYAEEDAFEETAFTEDDEEEESLDLNQNDLAILDEATQNAWFFEEPNFEDWDDDDEEPLF